MIISLGWGSTLSCARLCHHRAVVKLQRQSTAARSGLPLDKAAPSCQHQAIALMLS
jgi:hypothetical protein